MQFFAIIVIMIVMWWPAFSNPQPMPDMSVGVLYQGLYWMLSGSPILSIVLAILLIGVEGFWLNAILYSCRLVPQNSLMPMLLYVVAMSSAPAAATLTPIILVNLFMLLALHITIVRTELPTISSTTFFSVSMLVALATMASPYAFLLVLFLLVIMVLFKLYSVRDMMLFVLGFMAPYIIWLLCFFMNDRLPEMLQAIGGQLSTIHISIGHPHWVLATQNIYFLALIVVSLFMFGTMRRSHLIVDNVNSTLVVMFLICGLGSLFYGAVYPFNQQFFAISFAYIASVFFVNLPQKFFWNTLFFLYIAVSIATRYMI